MMSDARRRIVTVDALWLARLLVKNKRWREALERIARDKNDGRGIDHRAFDRLQHEARQALSPTEEPR